MNTLYVLEKVFLYFLAIKFDISRRYALLIIWNEVQFFPGRLFVGHLRGIKKEEVGTQK